MTAFRRLTAASGVMRADRTHWEGINRFMLWAMTASVIVAAARASPEMASCNARMLPAALSKNHPIQH